MGSGGAVPNKPLTTQALFCELRTGTNLLNSHPGVEDTLAEDLLAVGGGGGKFG